MTVKHPSDTLYSSQQPLVDFAFDERVADVFPDMIRRSVPGYESTIAMLGVFAGEYVKPQSKVYDLGCSLGAATLSMRRHIHHDGCEIIAVDNSQAMVERCKKNLARDESRTPVNVICDDISNIEINNASLVVLNFTLQFIPVESRLALLKKIHNGLLPGGALLLSEKIFFEDEKQNELFIDLHHAFKRANGYSDMEVSQKRAALEKVLLPETIEQHQQRLSDAGFTDNYLWMQSFNFVSLLALK